LRETDRERERYRISLIDQCDCAHARVEQMNISKAEVRGQETRMDRMVQRIERIIVIFFKNVLRATHTPIKAKQIDFAKIKAQVDAEAAAAAADASTSSSSPSISSLSSTDDWSASITAARDIIENGKPLTVCRWLLRAD